MLGLLPDWPSGTLLWPMITLCPQQSWEDEEASARIGVHLSSERCFLVSKAPLGCS